MCEAHSPGRSVTDECKASAWALVQHTARKKPGGGRIREARTPEGNTFLAGRSLESCGQVPSLVPCQRGVMELNAGATSSKEHTQSGLSLSLKLLLCLSLARSLTHSLTHSLSQQVQVLLGTQSSDMEHQRLAGLATTEGEGGRERGRGKARSRGRGHLQSFGGCCMNKPRWHSQQATFTFRAGHPSDLHALLRGGWRQPSSSLNRPTSTSSSSRHFDSED